MKGIHDTNAIDLAWLLQVFRKKHTAPGLLGCSKDQGVPEGEAMEAMQVDCRQNVREFGDGDVELRQQFGRASCRERVSLTV
jgi:hypothetical protein